MRIRKIQIFLIIFLLFLGLVFLSFPFLFEKEIEFKEVVSNREKTLVISDLHLESNPRNLNCIGNYLEENKIPLLVLNGDIFDKQHKKEFKEEFLDNIKEELEIKDKFPSDIVYNLSLYNHDPYLKKESKGFQINNIKVNVIQGILKLKIEEETFYIFHGDYIMSNSIGIAALINKLTSNLIWERLAKKVIMAEEDDWVILSHSHIPGIDYQRKLANTGSWTRKYIGNTDTAILIEAEDKDQTNVSLIKIPCESE